MALLGAVVAFWVPNRQTASFSLAGPLSCEKPRKVTALGSNPAAAGAQQPALELGKPLRCWVLVAALALFTLSVQPESFLPP